MPVFARHRTLQFGVSGLIYLLDSAPIHSEVPDYLAEDSEFSVALEEVSLLLDKPLSSPHGPSTLLESVFKKFRDRKTGVHKFFWGEIVDTSSPAQQFHECPVSPLHVTRESGVIRHIELHAGPKISAFLPGLCAAVVVTDAFVPIMQSAGFRGLTFTPCATSHANTTFRSPLFWQVEGTGSNIQIPLEILDGPNACPFCGYGPISCEQCGTVCYQCPECHHAPFAFPDDYPAEQDERIPILPIPPENQCWSVDAARWDGSDFVNFGGQVFVTRRVIDWLQDLGAGPWVADSVRCEFSGVTTDQHDAILPAAGRNRPSIERALRQIENH